MIGGTLMLKLDKYVTKIEYLFYGMGALLFLNCFVVWFGMKDVYMANKNKVFANAQAVADG